MSEHQHLSEFYSFVNRDTSSGLGSNSPVSSNHSVHLPIQNPRVVNLSQGRSSPMKSPAMSPVESEHSHTHYSGPSRLTMFKNLSVASLATDTSTLESKAYAVGVDTNHPDLPALITSKEVTETLRTYSGVLHAAQKYREALLLVSGAAAEFGAALEKCARCKGAGSSAESLLAAGGLHYLVSNHQQILAKSIHKTFEVPVRREVDLFKATMAANEEAFKKELKVKYRRLKSHENENARLSRMRVRNLVAYRNSLLELTSQIDDIDRLKYEHFCHAFDVAQITSTNLLTYSASVVRAEVEIYEGIARKGWSGGGLDDLIATCPDPFATNETDEDELEPLATVTKSTGNKFVKTLQGLLNPSAALATTAATSTTINSEIPQLSTPHSSNSANQPKLSAAKSLFSILPSKSILPAFDSKATPNDTVSYESDGEEGDISIPDHGTILDPDITAKDLKPAYVPGTASPLFANKLPGAPHNTDSLASSLSSGLSNQVCASTPRKLPPSTISPHFSPASAHKHSESSLLASPHLISSPIVPSATNLSTSVETHSTIDLTKRETHLQGPPEIDSDDMLGYSGWSSVRPSMS